jgi:hypothetical protein
MPVFGEVSGAPGRIRTPDPLIRSQVLYPAELPVQIPFRTETYVNSCVSVHTVGSACQSTTYLSMCANVDQMCDKMCPSV